jgi:hypothetical protein
MGHQIGARSPVMFYTPAQPAAPVVGGSSTIGTVQQRGRPQWVRSLVRL